MAHEFQFIVNGQLETYTRWEDIPEQFDNVIKFLPDVPHEEVDHSGEHNIWNDRLQELIKRETNARSM
jgi:hypothetical protein